MRSAGANKQNHLFTLRLWTEELEEGQSEWRGRVHYVATDEVRYFRDWPGLIPLLLAMLRDAERKGTLPDMLRSLSAESGDESAHSSTSPFDASGDSA